MNYHEQNKQLFLDYLHRHLLTNAGECRNNLELIITSNCNTKCSYCYYKNYGEQLYPKFLCSNPQIILDNCKKIIDWDKANDYQFAGIEIFSGEFFKFPLWQELLNYVLDNTPYHITIPTNATFLFSDRETSIIESYLDKYEGRIFLSLSIDGIYLDNDTRAIRSGKQYDDEYYDKAFKFAYKYDLAFHPMVGPKGIDKWIDNYKWYIDNVCKYFNITKREAFKRIYLLEVRNPDWSREELEYLDKFIEFLVTFTRAEYKDSEDYIENFLKKKGFNFFSSFVSTIGRGIGCSIQQTFAIRTGDLMLVPCHRTSYDGYVTGKLSFNGKDLDIDLKNAEVYMAINSFDAEKGMKCMDCFMSSLCSHSCLGCNLEVNKDPFIPVNAVCYLEYRKTKSIAYYFDKIGVLDNLINMWRNNTTKYKQLLMMKEIVENEV